MPNAGPTSGATSACSGTLLSPAEVGPEVEAELPAIPEVPGCFPEVPASRVFAASRWWADLGGAVLPALRESEPNGQIFWATYLRGLLPQ